MGLLELLCFGFLVAFAGVQATLPCSVYSSVGTNLFTVASSEEAAALASSLRCSKGDFAVQWVGRVVITETIRVAHDTSLSITGNAPDAAADGDHRTQLFVVEGASRLHFTDMTLANGSASSGGAIFADEQSLVSFTGTIIFTGNDASGGDGGAILAENSTLHWNGGADSTLSNNSASGNGGAIAALRSDISLEGGGKTAFFNNSADGRGGAIHAHGSTVFWDTDGTEFIYNSAQQGGAISVADASTMSWQGHNAYFGFNNASVSHFSTGGGGAISVENNSIVHWDGDRFLFSYNFGYHGGAIKVFNSSLSWNGDGAEFSFNWGFDGGAIYIGDYTHETAANLFWEGDGTNFSSNTAARSGGAIFSTDSTVSWTGGATYFSSNSVITLGYDGGGGGGAIFVQFCPSSLMWDGNTIFSHNAAGRNGGAVAFFWASLAPSATEGITVDIHGATFIGNTAAGRGGGIFVLDSPHDTLNFTDLTFQSNSASTGGAVAISGTGVARFFVDRSSFSGNTAIRAGGAVDFGVGDAFFNNSLFQGNSAGG